MLNSRLSDGTPINQVNLQIGDETFCDEDSMETVPMKLVRTFLILAALVLCGWPAQAEVPEAAKNVYVQLFEVMRNGKAETARSDASRCAAIGENLRSVQGLVESTRLDLEALVERCIFLAMNYGEFSDKTGDQCSHHLAYVKKLAAALESLMKEPDHGGQDLKSRAGELEQSAHNGELIGCKNDYKGFADIVAAAKAQNR